MDSDEEVTWIVTKNTVKHRMIESSLTHRFTDSKKIRRRTELLNNLLKRYRNLSRYQDYVRMRKLVNKKIHTDRETEDDNSYGEEDYFISHKRNLSLINDSAYSNENIDISYKSIRNNNEKKPKDTILKEKDTSLISVKRERKRLKTLQVSNANDVAVPVQKTRLLGLPKEYLEKIRKVQLERGKTNSSNSFNTTDNSISLETPINHTNPKSKSMENATTGGHKPKNGICSLNSDVIPSQRSPAKIKSTEIINTRFKIIDKEKSLDELPSCEFYNNIRLLQSSTPLRFSQHEEENESEESEEYKDSMNSSTLSVSERRQKQLENLNLTLESSSSSSEDEMPQKEDNLNEITALNNSHCMTSKKNTTWNKLKLNGSFNTDHKKDKSSLDIQNMTNHINHNNSIDQHNNYDKDLTKHKNISSKNLEPKIETFSERPCNLENFIKEENLVQDTTVPAFTLQDFLKEEDVFLVDIPITIKLADLQGHRIILKKKNLKLGKNKYEILYKDIPSQSCVFSTCADSKSYKLINIKPTGSVIVKRKLFSLPAQKYSEENTKSYSNVYKNK